MKTQLELGLNRSSSLRNVKRRRSVPGARWWFDQMHAMVDRAFDWTATHPGRPEQTYFTLASKRRLEPKL